MVIVFVEEELLGKQMHSMLTHIGCDATVLVEPRPDVRTALQKLQPAAALFDLSALAKHLDATELRELRFELDLALVGLLHGTDDEGDALRFARDAGIHGLLALPIHATQLHATLSLHLAPGDADGESEWPAAITGQSGTYAIGLATIETLGARVRALSLREREIFEFLVNGCGITELSERLHISPHTVRQHRKSVFRKLAVHSQVELMRSYRDAPRELPPASEADG